MPVINYEYKYRVAKDRIKWLEDGLKEIVRCADIRDNYGMIEDLAQSALDGEPTTADQYNTMQQDEKLVFEEQFVRISDVNKEIAIDWKNRKREEKIEKINKRKK